MAKLSKSKCLSKAHEILCQTWKDEKHLREEYPLLFADEVNYNLYKPYLAPTFKFINDKKEIFIENPSVGKGGIDVAVEYMIDGKSKIEMITFSPSVSYYEELFQ